MENKDLIVLAEAFNLLAQADLHLKGDNLPRAGAVIQEFQRIIQQLNEQTGQSEVPDEAE